MNSQKPNERPEDSEVPEPTKNELDSGEVFYDNTTSGDESIFSKEDKYVNRLDLVQYNNQTVRLNALKEFTRSFVPHMSDYLKTGSDTIFESKTTVPKNVKEALSRALIAAFGQIERICHRDLEPINVLFEENDESSDDDSFNDDSDGESDL